MFIATQVVPMQIIFITKPALKMITYHYIYSLTVTVLASSYSSSSIITITTISYFIISAVLIVLAPKTMALGAVATGSMKA